MVTEDKKPGKEAAGKVVVSKDGPYIVSGNLPLAREMIMPDKEGISFKWRKGDAYPAKGTYALCRCGRSTNKPYCTGAHAETGFNGTETASKAKYLAQAEKTIGPDLILTDAEALCSAARFCDLAEGAWKLTAKSGDPKSRKLAIREACDCPSGRLVVWDKKTKKPIEPKFKQSISIIEDLGANVSGPIWLKGGVLVESSGGTKYEIRNRATLCRCGQSANKPFCDGTHVPTGFNDGDKALSKRRARR